jgi:hypothetical protein
MKTAIVLLVGALLIVSSCATPEMSHFQNTSARLIGAPPDQVTITDLHSNWNTGHRWIAQAPSGTYECAVAVNLAYPACSRATPQAD